MFPETKCTFIHAIFLRYPALIWFLFLCNVPELQLDWFLTKDIGKDVVKHDGKFVISTTMETVGRGCTLKGIYKVCTSATKYMYIHLEVNIKGKVLFVQQSTDHTPRITSHLCLEQHDFFLGIWSYLILLFLRASLCYIPTNTVNMVLCTVSECLCVEGLMFEQWGLQD